MEENDNIPEWAVKELPAGLHNAPFLKDTASLEDFALQLTNASQHMGNSIRIPGSDASEDVRQEFTAKLMSKVPGLMEVDLDTEAGQRAILTKMGLPAEQAEYGAGEEHGWLAQVAFDSGLTKNQFTSLVTKLGDVNKHRATEKNASTQAEVQTLYSDWGLAKPQKMDNIEGLLKLTNAPDDLMLRITSGTADATTLKWLDVMASQFAEAAKFKKDENSPDHVTPAEAQVQIQELMANPEYMKNTPVALQMRQKMLKLQQAANPQAKLSLDGLVASGPELMEMFEAS